MSNDTDKVKNDMITDIMQACKANDVPRMDEIWLNLVFLDVSQLRSVAKDLHIAC